jgi:transcriptional regulator with XRE-family HTH domain
MKINTREIERLRKRMKFTVRDITTKLDMSPQSYYDIIRDGSTKISTLTALAKVLKCKAKSLLIE